MDSDSVLYVFLLVAPCIDIHHTGELSFWTNEGKDNLNLSPQALIVVAFLLALSSVL